MADNDVFDTDDVDADAAEPAASEFQPPYQIFRDSRIAVSKATGKLWKNRLDAALAAYEETHNLWNETFRYYNNNQTKGSVSVRGAFRRGDGTENIIFSNVNIMLPAVYSKDPNITCSTTDQEDQPFVNAMGPLLNALFRRKDKLGAKNKIKKAAGVSLLTDFGVFKLELAEKDDSIEIAAEQMRKLSGDLAKAKTTEEIEDIYGKLEALEESMEVRKPSGPSLTNVMPHNLIVDPKSEEPDATDANWMIERVYYSTAGLIARYTEERKDEESDEWGKTTERKLIYKPTHKARFTKGGQRDDALGMVLDHIGTGDLPASEDPRTAYTQAYFTECYLVWDKVTRRVMLFHKDDWTWPLWVWDDPLRISRFFPYFVIGYSFSLGGPVGPGQTAYVLDQQDTVNQINKQKNRIRNIIFNYFLYNSDAIEPKQAEKFIEAVTSNTPPVTPKILGVAAGETGDLSKFFSALVPPSIQYEELFNTASVLDSMNRITNTSDALRGVQFKTNTNQASVQSYQESMRLSVGAKVDVIEDAVGDLAQAVAEIAVRFYTPEDVAGLIGSKLATGWQQMSVEEFGAKYSVNIVAGSMEKPNSVFKKKEAIEVTQAVGQFATAAPGATLTIMLDVLQKAFTEINITPQHWDMLRQEIAANLQRGVSTTGTPAGGQGQPANGEGGEQQDLAAAAQNLSDEDKARVVQMRQQGVPGEDILAFIQERVNAPEGRPQQ